VLQAVQAIEIGCNAAVQALGDALALASLEQEALVARIADEGNLRKHCRHVGAGQNYEGCLLHAAVRLSSAHKLELLRERVLDIQGKQLRFRDLLVASDLLDEARKIVEGRFRERVFARRKFPGFQRSCQVQVVRFDTARFAAIARIRVNRDEQVRVGAVGDRRTLFQRDVPVVLACVDHFRIRNVFFDQLTQPQRHIEAKVLFEQTVRPHDARVVPPVARINRDAVDLQPQFPRQ